jgi:hypothetical protein
MAHLQNRPQPATRHSPAASTARAAEPLPEFRLVELAGLDMPLLDHYTFCPASGRLYAGYAKADQWWLVQWDPKSRRWDRAYRLDTGPGIVEQIAPSPDGRHIIIAFSPPFSVESRSYRCKVLIVDTPTEQVSTAPELPYRFGGLEFSSDGSCFKVLEAYDKSPAAVLTLDARRVESADPRQFVAAEDCIAWVVHNSGMLWCRNSSGRERLLSERVLNANFAVTRDRQFVAAVTDNGELIVWRTADAREVFRNKPGIICRDLMYDRNENRFLMVTTSDPTRSTLSALTIVPTQP